MYYNVQFIKCSYWLYFRLCSAFYCIGFLYWKRKNLGDSGMHLDVAWALNRSLRSSSSNLPIWQRNPTFGFTSRSWRINARDSDADKPIIIKSVQIIERLDYSFFKNILLVIILKYQMFTFLLHEVGWNNCGRAGKAQ